MTATVAHARLQRIRAIKAAERALGLDESAHRQLVFSVAGRESLKDCSIGELNAVLDHLNKRTGGYKGAPKAARPGSEALITKIEAQLADMRLPWKYAQAILKRVSGHAPTPGAGVDRLEWATAEQLHKVVAALAYEQEKRLYAAQVDALLEELGLARHDLPFVCAEAGIAWRADWPRKVRVASLYRSALLARRDRERAHG